MQQGCAATFVCLLNRTCNLWLCLMLLIANTSLSVGGVRKWNHIKAIKVPGRSRWTYIPQAFTVFNTHSVSRGALWKHKLTAQLCSFKSAIFFIIYIYFKCLFFLIFVRSCCRLLWNKQHTTWANLEMNVINQNCVSLSSAFTPQCCRWWEC